MAFKRVLLLCPHEILPGARLNIADSIQTRFAPFVLMRFFLEHTNRRDGVQTRLFMGRLTVAILWANFCLVLNRTES